MNTKQIKILAILFSYSCLFCRTGYGHGTVSDETAHEQEDAFLAEKVRQHEASGPAVLEKYFKQLMSSAPVNKLLSELVSGVIGGQANAAVGGSPALYGQWGALTTWPFAFASAANLPDGRILA